MTWTIDLTKPAKAPKPSLQEQRRLPRVTRWMALALRIDRLIREGVLGSFAEAAMLGSVTRARVSQIMNLIHLAPSIQEELLFMSRPMRGNEPILLADLQAICGEPDWSLQKSRWRKLKQECSIED
ncbi:MAG: hypothetical protein K2X38_09130 [Gemmataceae bacterium]|nr:hypothetical protein [Gemmataceae bacterium]